MQSGATEIYDFDDDNHIAISSFESLGEMEKIDAIPAHHVFNPYQFFKPISQISNKTAFLWPRGMPLQFVNDKNTYKYKVKSSSTSFSNVAIIQSLADFDPDVDAIYRMTTQQIPIRFTRKNTILI